MQVYKAVSELYNMEDTRLMVYLQDLVYTVCGSDIDDVFDDCMGGTINLIDTQEDLKKIYTTHISKLPKGEQDPSLGGWASVVEKEDSFDEATEIMGGEYVSMMLCTNNEGGNLFIIPKRIADEEPNIQKSIVLTREAWGEDVNHET